MSVAHPNGLLASHGWSERLRIAGDSCSGSAAVLGSVGSAFSDAAIRGVELRIYWAMAPVRSLTTSICCRAGGHSHRPTALAVSPGFTPRPSLSDEMLAGARRLHGGVAGVHTSAFVERCSARWSPDVPLPVSPGFTPRPSLSEPTGPQRFPRERVSPGFTPRPSLSDGSLGRRGRRPVCVAGVHTSAFVERACRLPCLPRGRRVAGVHTSAFVERCRASGACPRRKRCRRGSHLGLR